MNPDASPFTPGVPASADVFTGRVKHIEELLVAVRAAKRGKLSVAWIGGERGVGKSSLAAYVGAVAAIKEKMLFAHVPTAAAVTVKDIAQRAYLSLLYNNRNKVQGEKLFALFGERVREVGAYGLQLELTMRPGELPESLSGLARELAGIAEKSGAQSLALVFDDINDDIAGSPSFAHGIKSMVDGLAIHKAHIPVCMIFTGLDERLDNMRNINPSIARCFRPLSRVGPWTKEECAEFFRSSFKRAGVAVAADKINILVESCHGIPVMAHEFGDAVWRNAENKNIKTSEIRANIKMAARVVSARFVHTPEAEKPLVS